MKEMISNFTFFGMAISIFAFYIGFQIQKKWKHPLLNPLLLSTLLIIGFLILTGISFEDYSRGADYLSYFLTPATVCLAVPLYKQILVLKKNIKAIFAGILCGCLAHALIICVLTVLLSMDPNLYISLLSKSVTTAIALGITEEIGGLSAITVIGVMLAGILGAAVGPWFLRKLKVEEPVAVGLAMGTASHAVGTSKAIEMGEIQAAMSSLAIVVTGIMTVIIVPIVLQIFESLVR